MSINYSFGLPLKHNFAEQIYYNGLFLPHEIDRILQLWDDQQTIKATVSDGDGGKHQDELRKSSVMFIKNDPQNKWVYDKMAGLAMKTNNERYWFDLLGFEEELQLTRYSERDFFDWHMDFGAEKFLRGNLALLFNYQILMIMKVVIYSLWQIKK